MRRWSIYFVLGVLLAGCTLGPDYKRQAVSTRPHGGG